MPSFLDRPASRAALLGILLVILAAPAAAANRPPSQVAIEVTAAVPRGNLADDFFATDLGLGVKSGMEMGFRWRFWLSERWSLSPSFHFMNYKDFKSTTGGGDDFRIKPTSFRYMLEVMWMAGDRDKTVRPFLAVGGGLYRNRLEGYFKTYDKPFDSSVNTFGAAARAGLQLGQFEVSLLYSWNSFETWVLFRTGQAENYDWSNVGARVGWTVPFDAGAE